MRSKGLSFSRKRRKFTGEKITEVSRFIFSIILAVALAWFVVYNWGVKTNVIGTGMEPEFYNGQVVFINRLSYLFGKPGYGDVVVFVPNGNENLHLLVKRVVAVPGDKVQIKNGRIFVNEEEISGVVDYDKVIYAGIAEEPFVCNAGEYFLLGDNINYSEDSRSANIGPVEKDSIKGKVWFRLKKENSGMGVVF